MDIQYKLEIDGQDLDVYVNASKDDVAYLQRLALTFMIEQDMFPFRLLSKHDRHTFHDFPERIQ